MYYTLENTQFYTAAGNRAYWRHIVSDFTTEGGRVIVYMWIFAELETYFWKYLENGASELKNSKKSPLLTPYLEIISFKRWSQKIKYSLLKLNILW